MPSSKKIIASRQYSKFLESLQPFTIALVHEAFRVDRVQYLEAEKEQISVRLVPRLEQAGDGFFDARATLYLLITKAGEDRPLIRFTATYELHFHASHVTEENVERFVASELRIVIWPYFRELVNNASGRMHIPPIILPVGGQQRDKS
jgi:preprotein translocase subunit SecB